METRIKLCLGALLCVSCGAGHMQRETCLARADAAYWHEVADCERQGVPYDGCEAMLEAERLQDAEYDLCLEKY